MLRTPLTSRLLPACRIIGGGPSHSTLISCPLGGRTVLNASRTPITSSTNTPTAATMTPFRAFTSGATTPLRGRKLLLLEPYPHGKIVEFDPETLAHRVVVDQIEVPDGIQVDVTKDRMWWTNMGPSFDIATGVCLQADGSYEVSRLDGSERRKLFGNGLFVTGKQLTYDKDSQQLYFCDREGMRVFRVDADGSNLTVLVQTGVFPQDTKDASRHCVGIAVDKKRAGKVYWTQKGPWTGGEGSIRSAGLTIPPGEDAATRSDINVLVDKLPGPIDLEISPDGNKMYWTDRNSGTLSVGDLSADGTALTNRRVLADDLGPTIALVSDHDKGVMYITDFAGYVYEYSLKEESSGVAGKAKKLNAKFSSLHGMTIV